MSESSVEVNTVLVPVDGSDESVRAVEYATAIADRYGATVHALYVFGEEVSRAIETGAIAEDDIIDETESFIDGARDIAEDADVEFGNSIAYGFSTHSKLRHPGSTVLDCADEIDADFLVIPRSVSDEPGTVLERAAEYVLLYASQPVLSV